MEELEMIKCQCPVCHDGYKDEEGRCKITHLIKAELVSCIDGYTTNGPKCMTKHMPDDYECRSGCCD